VTPTNNNLGHVQVIIPTDGGKETWRALRLLEQAAKRAGFSLTTMTGQVAAREALTVMRSKCGDWKPVQ
jgi:hypothetical protein